jgi:hypothetical protein
MLILQINQTIAETAGTGMSTGPGAQSHLSPPRVTRATQQQLLQQQQQQLAESMVHHGHQLGAWIVITTA